MKVHYDSVHTEKKEVCILELMMFLFLFCYFIYRPLSRIFWEFCEEKNVV
jgi:hypothetical protein